MQTHEERGARHEPRWVLGGVANLVQAKRLEEASDAPS
jgi:hypothetical protein